LLISSGWCLDKLLHKDRTLGIDQITFSFGEKMKTDRINELAKQADTSVKMRHPELTTNVTLTESGISKYHLAEFARLVIEEFRATKKTIKKENDVWIKTELGFSRIGRNNV
jgi:hypothetical protein